MHAHTLVLPVDEGIDGVGKAAGQAVHADIPTLAAYVVEGQSAQVLGLAAVAVNFPATHAAHPEPPAELVVAVEAPPYPAMHRLHGFVDAVLV